MNVPRRRIVPAAAAVVVCLVVAFVVIKRPDTNHAPSPPAPASASLPPSANSGRVPTLLKQAMTSATSTAALGCVNELAAMHKERDPNARAALIYLSENHSDETVRSSAHELVTD